MRNYLKLVLLAATVVAAVVAVGVVVLSRAATIVSDADGSSSQVSQSRAEAEGRGVLMATPVVTSEFVEMLDLRYPILGVWIEEHTHLESRLLVLRHYVHDGRYRIVARIGTPPGRPDLRALSMARLGGPVLTYNNGVQFNSRSGSVWHREIVPPWPDSVRLRVVLQ